MKVDLLMFNGSIITIDEKNTRADWVAVNNGKIVDIGKKDGFKKYLEDADEAVDLMGKCVLPGFYDSHVHLVQTGLNELCLDLKDVTSLDQLFERLSDEAKKTPEGELIRAWGLDELKLKERRMPTRHELDACVPNNPLWINRIEFHVSILNSMALNMLNFPFNLEGIIKDKEGLPTGMLMNKANFLVRSRLRGIISDSTREKGVHKALDIAIEKGITSLNAMEGGFLFNDKGAEFVYKNKVNFPIDITLFYQIVDVEKVIEKGLKRIGGCIFLDGSFGSRTAALDAPYIDKNDTCGELYFSQEELNDFVLKAHKNNLQVAVHAIGARAIEQILTAYEYAQKIYPRKNHRHRIEHFELPRKDHLERAAKLNLIISMQPAYEHYWGGEGKMYDMRLGPDRRKLTNPFNKILDKGLVIAGGSDSDVTGMDPILGIHTAVNHPNEEYAIDVFDAVKMFTINGAKAVFQEEEKGSIEIRKFGDFVVVDKNPLDIEKEIIKDIKVMMTIKEGNILFERERL
ncbi:amidohydrolase [Wukongibacter baidiensis]|uniref:amidohydrolase n=1 Tax=Wukongibacter baidiensis TaxID=1723361 RepID=UPI003D7F5DE6